MLCFIFGFDCPTSLFPPSNFTVGFSRSSVYLPSGLGQKFVGVHRRAEAGPLFALIILTYGKASLDEAG